MGSLAINPNMAANPNPFLVPPGSPTASNMGGAATAQKAMAPASVMPGTSAGPWAPGTGVVANPSMTPMGGFVGPNGQPIYDNPNSLATAINANYQASYPGGGYKPVTPGQMSPYFPTNPTMGAGASPPTASPFGQDPMAAKVMAAIQASGGGGAPVATPPGAPPPGTQPVTPGAAPAGQPGQPGGQPNYAQLLQLLTGSGMSPDQALAQIAQTGGMPLNAVPAWQAMVQAQQQNIGQGTANMLAAYGNAGQVPQASSDFGKSLQMYMNQAVMNQNATLGQMQLPLLQQMASQQYGATGQLSSQAFQGQTQSAQNAFQSALAAFQGGTAAAGQLAGQGTQGATGMFNASTSAAQQQAQLGLLLQQLGVQGAGSLGSLTNQNLLTGGQLGQQQYTDTQSALNNAYQAYLQGLPQYNPLLSYLFSGGNAYPPTMTPGYQPSGLSQTIAGIGQGAQAGLGIASLIEMLPFLGLSDVRAKENIEEVGSILPLLKNIRATRYDYIGGEKNRIGVIAQEVKKFFPDLVKEVYGGIHLVDYGGIATLALKGVTELAQHFDELDRRVWSMPA